MSALHMRAAVGMARVAYSTVMDAAAKVIVSDPGERVVLVDGSALSPATRRLPGGEETWNFDVHDVFVDEFDALMDGMHPDTLHGWTLTWDEGMLVLDPPEEGT